MSLLRKERPEVLQYVQAHQDVSQRPKSPRAPTVLNDEHFISARVDATMQKINGISSSVAKNQMSYQSHSYIASHCSTDCQVTFVRERDTRGACSEESQCKERLFSLYTAYLRSLCYEVMLGHDNKIVDHVSAILSPFFPRISTRAISPRANSVTFRTASCVSRFRESLLVCCDLCSLVFLSFIVSSCVSCILFHTDQAALRSSRVRDSD